MTLHDTLFTALKADPTPIDGARVLQIAQGILPAREYQQFNEWTKANGVQLLEMLNG